MPSIEDLRKVEAERLRALAHQKNDAVPEHQNEFDMAGVERWDAFHDRIEYARTVEQLRSIISELEDGKVGG